MLEKEDLKRLLALKKRLKREENKESKVCIDSVRGSSTRYPYIKHTIVVEGLDYSKEYIKREISKIEKEIKNVNDIAVRDVIIVKFCLSEKANSKYLTWQKTASILGYNSEATVRNMVNRFLKKK